jgi:nitroreductase
MELDEATKGRRGIRSYKDEGVPIELVREVLEAGTWASSAKNGQQWRFTVMTGDAKA